VAPLDLGRQDRRGGEVRATRAEEVHDERSYLLTVESAGQPVGELYQMLVERSGALDEPAVVAQQVLEVVRAGLPRGELGGAHGVDRLPEDAGLELGRRVQPDHDIGVKQVVEQVLVAGSRLRVGHHDVG
jgi:hypothetical protein